MAARRGPRTRRNTSPTAWSCSIGSTATKLTKVSEAPIGAWSQGASFSKDGKTVVVSNMIQKNLQVFKNDDGKLTDTGQKIPTSAAAPRRSALRRIDERLAAT